MVDSKTMRRVGLASMGGGAGGGRYGSGGGGQMLAICKLGGAMAG